MFGKISSDYIPLSAGPDLLSTDVYSTQNAALSEAEQVARIEGVVAEWQESTKGLSADVRKRCMDRVRQDTDMLKQHLKKMISNGVSGPGLQLIVDRALTDLNHSTMGWCQEHGIALQQRVVTRQTLDAVDRSLENVSLSTRTFVAHRKQQALTSIWQKASGDYASPTAAPMQECAEEVAHGQEYEEISGLGELKNLNREIIDSQLKQAGVKTPSIFGTIEAVAKAQVPESEENVVRHKLLSVGAKYISKFIPGVGQAEFVGEIAKEYEPGFRKLKEKYPLANDYIEPQSAIAQLCHFDADPSVSIHMVHGMLEFAEMSRDGVKSLRKQIVSGSAAVCDKIGLTDQSVVERIEAYGYQSTAEFRQNLGEECGLAYASMQAHRE